MVDVVVGDVRSRGLAPRPLSVQVAALASGTCPLFPWIPEGTHQGNRDWPLSHTALEGDTSRLEG